MRRWERFGAVVAVGVLLLVLVPAPTLPYSTHVQPPATRALPSLARLAAGLPDGTAWSTATGRSSPGAPDLRAGQVSLASSSCPNYSNTPAWLAYDAAEGSIWVASPPSCVNIYTSNLTFTTAISVGQNPFAVAIDNVTDLGFVTNTGSDNVSVISGGTDQVVASVPVGSQPAGAAYDRASDSVYVANTGSNNVSVISAQTLTVVATIPVGTAPVGVVVDSATGQVFVTNSGSANVSVISDATNSVVATVATGNGPYGIALDNRSDELFVTDPGSYNVTVIDAGTDASVAAVPVAQPDLSLQGIAYDPETDQLWIGAGYWYAVVINATARIVVGYLASDPAGVIYVPDNGAICFTNSANRTFGCYSGNPAWYAPATPITFAETGLPVGWSWSVSIGAAVQYSTDRNISFGLTPTAFSYDFGYTISAANGFTATPASGSVTSNGYPMLVNVSFAAVADTWEADFVAVGLPNGTTWAVLLNGSWNATTSPTNSFRVPNGTYNYSVPSLARFAPTIANGTIVVAGLPVTVDVEFSLIPAIYTVTFVETGLPDGTSWPVTFNGLLERSLTPSVVFHAINGTYAFSVVRLTYLQPTPSAGTVPVDGANVTVRITYTPLLGPTFDLWFNETGLPTGTNWSVTLSGSPNWSATDSIGFVLPIQFFGDFVVGSVPGFFASPASGAISQHTSLLPLTIPIVFAPGTRPPSPPQI
ncbi:MAG: YncE family protein, partial [Thermoplasmata archaeon]|nr:YncE family protein [Thermoplasmata archaeon]